MQTGNISSGEDASDLARRIEAGDSRAEAEMAERYSRGIRIMIQRSLSDTDAVDDLCQETMVLVIRKVRAGDLRESAGLPGFIASVARNLVIVHGRRRRSEPLGETDPPMAADQLENVIRAQRAKRVQEVLQALPNARDREVLLRFYLTGEEKDSICRRLGLTSLHFNRVLQRARDRYRTLYGELG